MTRGRCAHACGVICLRCACRDLPARFPRFDENTWRFTLAKGKKKQVVKPRRIVSGAVGGPSTGAGLNYEINYALMRALQLLPQVLSFPVRNPFVQVEPRAVGQGAVTRWDLGFEGPNELAEAKLNPTKQDLSEWIARSAEQASSGNTKFLLVYSKSTGRRLIALEQMMRIAGEVGSDKEKFTALVELEEVSDSVSLLAELGENPQELLRRMKLEHVPDHVLDEQINFCCTVLAGPERGKRLRDLLFTRIAEAVPSRATLYVRDLIQAARNDGIQLSATSSIDIPGLPKEIRDTILLLNECPVPIPVEVLGEAVATTPRALFNQLESAGLSDVVVVAADKWKLAPLPVPTPHADGELCARALKAILAFIEVRKYETGGREQVHNAVALARICATTHPEALARMFIALDKPLKCWGDKHLVLDVAELAITAARRVRSRGRAEAEGEAQAMICGKSWALQRIGRLEEAKIAAEISLRLGEEIGWDRNTAYCEKCIGRLFRIMGEATSEPIKKAEFLTASVEHLETAIARFTMSPEFGAQHPEVGDCYSLLGRTYLVSGNGMKAAESVRKATALLSPTDGKDYLDLCILRGELLEPGDRDAAEAHYSEVVDQHCLGDFERSEISARAHFRRAINRAAMGKKTLAMRDFEKAEELWDQLGESENAAQAAWERNQRLGDAITGPALRLLSQESFRLRVSALRVHQDRLAQLSGKRVARRAEPGTEYWLQLIKDARMRVAVEFVQW
jgi:tetratricopeptide (TPR) repeat protein